MGPMLSVEGGAPLPNPLPAFVPYTCLKPKVVFPKRSAPKVVEPFADDPPTAVVPAVVTTPAALVP